jgi:hypothetical protein
MRAVSKTIIVSFVSLLCLFVPIVSAAGISADKAQDAAWPASQTLTLNAGKYEISEGGNGFDVISMEGFSLSSSPGDPVLPYRVYDIAVPADADLSSLEVKVISEEKSTLGGTYDIGPGAPDAAWSGGGLLESWGGKDIAGGKNVQVYVTDAPFPAGAVQMLSPSQMRKWKFARVQFTPMQYNPVSGELILTSHVKIEISCARTAVVDAGLMADSAMDDVAASTFVNYQAAEGWYAQKALDQPSAGTYDYVIITTNAIEAGSANLSSFVTYKQGIGHSVLVITEDEYGGLTGQFPNHRAEKIRQWLIGNYSAMGIEYVLLIGDPTPYESGEGGVPMKMCWPIHNDPSYGTYESPTDYFYADLTGNWDYDGDGYYGEWNQDYFYSGSPAGGVDFSPEVYVGRIPVYGTAYSTLDGILYKTMSYEAASANLSWRRSILMPMGFQNAGYDGAPLGEQMKDDYLGAAGFTSWRMYQQGSAYPADNSVYSSEEELRGGTVVRSRWAATDYGIVAWWGHGSQTAAVVGTVIIIGTATYCSPATAPSSMTPIPPSPTSAPAPTATLSGPTTCSTPS